MYKLKLHTNDKKFSILCPTAWGELSLSQFMELEPVLRDDPDTLKAFSILTGLNIEITENLTDSNIEEKVFSCIEFLVNPPKWDKLPLPKYLTLNSQKYKVPRTTGELMWGQKTMIKQTIENAEELVENIPTVLAVIMQPYIDKISNKGKLKYTPKRVAQIALELKKCNGLECYSIALFFFQKLKNIFRFGIRDLQTSRRTRHQTRSLLKNWLKVSV